ncbi:Tat pathway signal sequence domain protein [Aquisalimonas sp.]|uniref:Tat pathway signal sequence domain protein n=1 Tax=Aquisalimonas sp. TaxID=1872621 RepID=UPI0025B852D9|nr:Tat pathway signal sequence domain protein [Aquisalimonas sp.]
MRAILLALVIGVIGTNADAESGAMTVELNKLEPRNGSCLAYLVLENDVGVRFETFRLDLVMFDTDGIIARRLALEAGPLEEGKTAVKMFDITDLPCQDLGRVLLNEVIDCEAGDGTAPDCTAYTHVTARTEVPFIK